MADDGREFVSCENVLLELLPKPTYEKRQLEINFYNEHFHEAEIEPFSRELGKDALALALKYGIAAGDALNIASAIRQKAGEFYTTELSTKPVFRVKGIKVISILG